MSPEPAAYPIPSASAVALRWLQSVAPGLLLCALLAALGFQIAGVDALARNGVSPLTAALLLGLVAGNLPGRSIERVAAPGLGVAKQRLLRLGVILYGLRLTLQDVRHVGAAGVAIDVVMLSSTFLLALWAGRRWFGLDTATCVLVGAGSAICGAAAVVATQPVLRARDDQATVAVATVVLFGTVAIFLYPLLHGLALLPTGAGFGLYIGSTVHEVAQVLAIGASLGGAVEQAALIEKMMRVLLLAPFLVLVAAAVATGRGRRDGAALRAGVPWFALVFCGVVVLNSLPWMPPEWRRAVAGVDTALLATAMAALGFSAKIAVIRRAGARPAGLALLLFAWLVVGGAVVNRGLSAWLS